MPRPATASAYHEAKAHITTRLQMGTTKGNPELVGEWNQAQSALDQLTGNINSLNAVGTDVAGDSSRAHYVLDTIQAAFDVSGAVDEDHRQLSVLQDETNQTIMVIDKLLTQVSEDVQRQTAYVANERANLTTLAAAIKNGELYGGELGGVMLASGGAAAAYANAAAARRWSQSASTGQAWNTSKFSTPRSRRRCRPGPCRIRRGGGVAHPRHGGGGAACPDRGQAPCAGSVPLDDGHGRAGHAAGRCPRPPIPASAPAKCGCSCASGRCHGIEPGRGQPAPFSFTGLVPVFHPAFLPSRLIPKAIFVFRNMLHPLPPRLRRKPAKAALMPQHKAYRSLRADSHASCPSIHFSPAIVRPFGEGGIRGDKCLTRA